MPNMSSPDVYLAIEAALTFEQRDLFLEQFHRMCPRQQGIHIADAVDILCNQDAHIDYTEPLWEAHGDEITEDLRDFVTPATIALIYVTRDLETVTCQTCKGKGEIEPTAIFAAQKCFICEGVGTETQPVAPTWAAVKALAGRAKAEVTA